MDIGVAARMIRDVCAHPSSVFLGFIVLVFAAASVLALTFPALTGRVVDEAGILDPASKAALEQKLADFEAKTTGQLVVVTLKSLQGTSIEDYGYQLGRYWQIGQKDKNTGALLIIAPNERKVRIEVGYGFEGTLTDAVSKLIIENAIVPRLRVNDFAGGINRGVDDIIQAVSVDSEEWKERARQRPDDESSLFDVIALLFFLFIFFMVVNSVTRQGRGYARRTERELTRTDHCTDTRLLGTPGFSLVRGPRRLLWRRRILRRRWRIWKFPARAHRSAR
jgi:uncharacterized protein